VIILKLKDVCDNSGALLSMATVKLLVPEILPAVGFDQFCVAMFIYSHLPALIHRSPEIWVTNHLSDRHLGNTGRTFCDMPWMFG